MQEHGPKRRKEHIPQKRGIYTSHSMQRTLSQLRGCQGVVRAHPASPQSRTHLASLNTCMHTCCTMAFRTEPAAVAGHAAAQSKHAGCSAGTQRTLTSARVRTCRCRLASTRTMQTQCTWPGGSGRRQRTASGPPSLSGPPAAASTAALLVASLRCCTTPHVFTGACGTRVVGAWLLLNAHEAHLASAGLRRTYAGMHGVCCMIGTW